jgi:hypothetical protein
MSLLSQLEDEILTLKKQLQDERTARSELEQFKREQLVELKAITEETIQKTKNRFLEEIELLKNEKRAIQSQLDAAQRELRDVKRGSLTSASSPVANNQGLQVTLLI